MISERLKERRKDFGDTQAAMARKLNVSLSNVKSWECGNSSPSHEMLVEICRLYHVSSDFLLGLMDEDPLLHKEQLAQLSPGDKALMRLFEEFLLYREQMYREQKDAAK